MKILLIDNGTSYLEELKKLLISYEIDVRKWNKAGFENIEQYDLVILSGGHTCSIVNHEDIYNAEINFIKNCRKPLIGICLGCELIAYAFGARLKKLDCKERGPLLIKFLDEKSGTKEIDSVHVFENHRWAIQDLSDDLVGLAKSRDGFEIIKHKNLPIYGLQFHPEIDGERDDGKEVFMELLEKLCA
ncbi:hypothetical protein A2617_02805 [Candidatus Daviesbacteria bacterium RIFOXYD1_FULL_41_10]|uniref:Glutamine amidotransferase domain-containing protein n=1 Tax=Candidatus Daviesbacteria bacterium RIFOXYD1_FULL_41_10 TaxID=1797801 RepID=A0A1F5N349_9BACT|nr:MAG: hypothetical protein A2617_02805 [Candidatus Daviesbacteria bacterium RIFOXYD1_FULL_41_10]